VSPYLAAVTNISPDHLNRYRDFEQYAQAKAEIFRYQQPGDHVVLNLDSPPLNALARQVPSHPVWTSRRRPLGEGAVREGNLLVWRWGGRSHEILDIADLNNVGEHNIENALIAIALGMLAGAEPVQVREALVHFPGVEHRQEMVRELGGVTFVNDTTATAPAATVAALRALAPQARGIVLIAGGSDKGLDYAELARMIASSVKHVVLLEGTATDKLAGAIEAAGGGAVITGRYDDFQRAVEQARQVAERGDLVLLSPGCASFGMFANEFERGEQFKRIVNRWGD
jgi:UDP-N-acetylmuramoylalanine--D-glutamate ligase